MTRKTVLTIAGFDPSSGAGITADLATIAAHGLFGTSAATALTVQSTVGVRGTHPVDASLLTQTLDCLEEDLPAAGVKIGMLAASGLVNVVAQFLERKAGSVPVVLDPVIRSSSGRELLSPEGLAVLRERLLPQVDWVTPNMEELALLSGLPVESKEDLPCAVDALRKHYPRLGILATGGHRDPPDDLVATPGQSAFWLPGTRIASRATHGTGCAFSTAFLCGLVRGRSTRQAAEEAKRYVTEGIRRAEPRGNGAGPLDLYWPMRA